MSFTPQFAKNTTLADTMAIDETTSATLSSAVFTDFTDDYLVIDYDIPAKREVIKCNVTGTAISSITREQEGTSAVEHASGAKVGYMFLPSHYNALKDGTGLSYTWKNWTPTIAASGSMTTASTSITAARYLQVGSIVHFSISFTTTTGGSAGTYITFTLPVTPASLVDSYGWVRDNGAYSAAFAYYSGGVMNISKSSPANWALTSNQVVHISGTYEVA